MYVQVMKINVNDTKRSDHYETNKEWNDDPCMRIKNNAKNRHDWVGSAKQSSPVHQKVSTSIFKILKNKNIPIEGPNTISAHFWKISRFLHQKHYVSHRVLQYSPIFPL